MLTYWFPRKPDEYSFSLYQGCLKPYPNVVLALLKFSIKPPAVLTELFTRPARGAHANGCELSSFGIAFEVTVTSGNGVSFWIPLPTKPFTASLLFGS